MVVDRVTRITEAEARQLQSKAVRVSAPIGKAPKIPKVNDGEELFSSQLVLLGLPKFERQLKFAESLGRQFAADFCQIDYRLIVEINGGIWRKGGGAHSHPTNLIHDMVRQQHAARLGYLFLPFTPDEVYSGHAIEWTTRTLESLGWKR